MYKIITNPTATVIFYTRTIIEALTTGALTEKEIRTSTLDICKDLGIKSTCRGTIAGLNLDVPAICNILASYGVLELDTSSISTINVRNSLSTYRKQLIDQGKEQANQVQSDTTIANHSSGSTNDIDVIDGELNTLALADVTGKSFLGDEIFRSISLRWKEKLTKYLLDSQSTHIQGLQIAALAATAAAAKSASDSLINTDFDGTSSANVQFSTSNEFYFDTTDHQIYEENGEDIYTDMRTMVAPNSNTNSVPSPKANTSFWSTEAVDSLPISSSNDISNGYFYDNFNNSSNSNNYNNNNNSSSTNVNNSDPIADLVETTGNEATSKVLKRASNQRAWRLAVDVSHLRNPEKLLNEWSDACYAESAALETEEAVLRRLVGQCKLGIDNKPRRLGTAYLTQTLVENSTYGQSDLDLPGPRTLRQGAELTGDQLWEKARAAFVRKKLQSKGIPRASLGSSDTMNAYGVSFSMPHPSTIGEDGSGYLTHTGANKYVKKITNAAGTGETRAQHGVATFRAARLRSYVPPVVLQHDGVYRESVTQKGSIFASQFPAPPSSFPATVIRPDLMLFTTAIPWSALAREFVTMDYEDLHHESAISSANPSQPNSARGTSFTPKYENSSSHIYDKKSDRISLTNSPHKLQSGDKGARRPLSISVSMPTLGTFPVSAPASNSKPSEVLAPTFTEIEPISVSFLYQLNFTYILIMF